MGNGRRLALAALAGALLLALWAAPAAADDAALRRVGTFNMPVYVTAPPGDNRRVFVVEQAGRIRVERSGRTLRRPFLSIRGLVKAGGERGLLSMAFAPEYERTRRFYVYYTDERGDIRIEEFRRSRRSRDRAARSTRRLVLRQRHRTFPNHNGGQLQFGPDGFLYAGFGDGGGGGDPFRSAQSLGTLLGKLIRIDPRRRGRHRYTVPDDNPFTSRSGAQDEIFALGLRNPFRFSFDRSTGDLTLGDVGQNAVEEIDFVPSPERGSGANFGWSRFEGNRPFPGGDSLSSAGRYTPPVIEQFRSEGWRSIIGGYVVRDPSVPDLEGRYVYGDFFHARLRSARLSAATGASGDRAVGPSISGLSSFGEDARGRVYATSLSGGVFRLVAP